MKKTTKQWMMPAFAFAVGISFVAAEAYAAKAEVDLTGRARGWYQTQSKNAGKKDGESSKSVSSAEFRADGRIGIMISTTEGNWTGSAKAEIESHDDKGDNDYSTTYRDVWAQIENEQFSLRMGRHEANHFCVSAIVPFGTTAGDCLGDVFGRAQALTASFKGLPVTPSLSYFAYEDKFKDSDDNDENLGTTAAPIPVPGNVSGFVGHLTGTFANVTAGFVYGSKSHKGNKDQAVSGASEAIKDRISRQKADTTKLGLFGSYPINQITVSGGVESTSIKKNSGALNAKDSKDDTTAILLAGKFDIGNGMAASANVKINNQKENDGTANARDKKTDTTAYGLGFEMSFASTTLSATYGSDSTKVTQSGATNVNGDGASKSGFAFGLASNF